MSALLLFVSNASGLESSEGTSAVHNALVQLQAEYKKVLEEKAKLSNPDRKLYAEEEADEDALEKALAEADEVVGDLEDKAKQATLAHPVTLAAHATQPKLRQVLEKPQHKVEAKPHLRAPGLLGHLRAAAPAKKAPHKEVAPVVIDNGAEMTPSDFEASIANLAKLGSLGLSKAEFAATPFGSSVAQLTTIVAKNMMPRVSAAHKTDEAELKKLQKAVQDCSANKEKQIALALPKQKTYKAQSPKHVACRQVEASLHTDKLSCWLDEGDKKTVKQLKCKEFAMIEAKYSNQKTNRDIVTKSGSEQSETYISRISSTICGKSGGKGAGGFGAGGFFDEFTKAKKSCEAATLVHLGKLKKCQAADALHSNKQKECNNMQDQMDAASCGYATNIKDACEEYEECYSAKKGAFNTAAATVAKNAIDRKAEWRGLQRMMCIVTAFSDGNVTNVEINACQKKTHNTGNFTIIAPTLPSLAVCSVPKEYPTTPEYKKKQFAVLPELAKGKIDANRCPGLKAISTTPRTGSPKTCKCVRLTMNGPYSAGPLVKCENCLDIKRSTDKNSCPVGTKLFSPSSRQDWKTFIRSTGGVALRAPHFVVDITRSTSSSKSIPWTTGRAMSSISQRSWVTGDKSPWWLRTAAVGLTGDYTANCFMNILKAKSEDDITTNFRKCDYHSKSYFCQLKKVATQPKEGSPAGCTCNRVDLTGDFSAETLIKCTGCLEVSKSLQKNSCPHGTKLFAPASRQDWKTFLASTTVLRSPNFIIDVTRPTNGCGGCGKEPMNSASKTQATWRTSDGAPWWLRSTTYFQPKADYLANCYLDVWGGATENAVTFGSSSSSWTGAKKKYKGCEYRSNAYYCQTAKIR